MTDIRLKLMEAIARQSVVATRYNGEALKLAPHLLFERHGDLFLVALNLNKRWRSEDDRHLGQFKLSGLSGADLLDETFDPLPTFEPAAPRTDDMLVMAI